MGRGFVGVLRGGWGWGGGGWGRADARPWGGVANAVCPAPSRSSSTPAPHTFPPVTHCQFAASTAAVGLVWAVGDFNPVQGAGGVIKADQIGLALRALNGKVSAALG